MKASPWILVPSPKSFKSFQMAIFEACSETDHEMGTEEFIIHVGIVTVICLGKAQKINYLMHHCDKRTSLTIKLQNKQGT